MSARITDDWLVAPSLQAVFAALETDDDRVRVVGGAVRNTLLGVPVTDIDLSTTAEPSVVMARAKAHGLKPVPTGFDHGTVTIVSDGVPYEVTTLREDVETHGRSATVRFGRNWQHDAERRDFTMNALYADRDGTVFDPVGGLPDLKARHVRFIGDASRRIAEDYLRILRFFRFHAQYGVGELNAEGLRAVTEARAGLSHLSAERIGMELRKLVSAPGAVDTVAVMHDAGILQYVLATPAGIGPFRALRALDAVAAESRDPALCLAILSDGGTRELQQLADHLRLSNAERKRMIASLEAGRAIRARLEAGERGVLDELGLAELLYRHGRVLAIDGLLYAWAEVDVGPEDPGFRHALERLRVMPLPVLPVSGADLIAAGARPGPDLGRRLRQAESLWLASGFRKDRAALIAESGEITGD
ncbi:CCA tRNA nucleotidyltransferase [Stappia indica]|uniref:CCA tRNA nucleotidyltransferase n=1 Tax=Stappia indica TaxID=538381 RepID=UPI001CD5276A|nr:CCA tRNA nucleotidyltransferase [Stappia indica]MCA1299309.1 CCA tRNA nucleotidyltransferase [Stappia indica]